MDISDVEKKKKTLEIFAQSQDPSVLLNHPNLDDESLAYLAENLAWSWKVDSAIIMIKHGVFASPVIRWAEMYAPEWVNAIKRAEFEGFRYIYEKNPDEWAQKKLSWQDHLKSQKNKNGDDLYSPEEIESILKQYGYGENVKQNLYC